VTPSTYPMSFGMFLGNCLYPESKRSLNCRHRLAIMEACLYYLRVHDDYEFRMFSCDLGQYISLHINYSLILSPSLSPFSLGFPTYNSAFLGGIYAYYIPLKPLTKDLNVR